ncbi:MAG TPA: heavy-metal-associated domain-containing protein [Candidatus Acidoferrales bacterium]|nr:heavy-metal-associated domain-containing protein [Candidatus Acidoferrales bacterium]
MSKSEAVRRTRTAIISVENLTAEAFPVLRAALKAVPGVETVAFNVERSVVSVDFDIQKATVDDLLRAVLKAGYKVI